MRILFVHPAVEMSVADVSRGYRNALERSGHDIHDYWLGARFQYHRQAVPEDIGADAAIMSRLASENILNEAMYHNADIVLIISGLNVHPIALWLLGRVDIPAAIIFTESPYDDESQKQWMDISHVGGTVNITAFTNDLFSARKYGWNFLPPAFDPAIHRPVEPDEDTACDVLMVGTGWGERQSFLEAVDWTGIRLGLYGIWPGLDADSPLFPFFHPLVVNNRHVPAMYAGAKICINLHRRNPDALTPGPRIYEAAACGAFQMTDWRQGVQDIFGQAIPTFDSPADLRDKILFYLANDGERVRLAATALDRVLTEDFDHRAAELEAVLLRQPQLVGKG